jgi:hypothetical protein
MKCRDDTASRNCICRIPNDVDAATLPDIKPNSLQSADRSARRGFNGSDVMPNAERGEDQNFDRVLGFITDIR